MDSVMLHKCFQGDESEATTTVKEEVGGSKGMSLTKRCEWVTEIKTEDEEGGDSGKIAAGDEIGGRQNSEQAGKDFRDSTLEGEIVKDQQSLEDQMEETSEGNITETETTRSLEEKASVSYSFPFGHCS